MEDTFRQYPDIGPLLPAMGYSPEQIRDMERTINATECDVVIVATPIDLRRLMKIEIPSVRVGYELEEIGRPKLEDVIGETLARLEKGGRSPKSAVVPKRAVKKPPKSGIRKAARKAGPGLRKGTR
jgi:hypothetical protein